jgi:hypothetical protein
MLTLAIVTCFEKLAGSSHDSFGFLGQLSLSPSIVLIHRAASLRVWQQK